MHDDKHYGTVEIEMPNGEYLVTEVVKEDDEFITGTFTNNSFLRDMWEVDINEYNSQQEALEELYYEIEEYANSPAAMQEYA
jgi:hypothetical protein